MRHYKMFIGGAWVESSRSKFFESLDPYKDAPWAMIPEATEDDVDRAVQAAWGALRKGAWRAMSASARGVLLRKLGDLVATHGEELARTETIDNGKLISEMSLQLKYAVNYFNYFGGMADKIEGSVPPIERPGYFNYTRREPIGVVAAITPWNSPLMLAVVKLTPALAAGCTVVIKPSEYTSVSTLEFCKLVEAAGFPPGVINVITGGRTVGERLVSHPRVQKVCFTGSEGGGRSVYTAAAQGFKSVTLELGGKSPNIVFDDCVLADAVNGAISGIFAASGQTCIAGSRLLVQDGIYDEFVDQLLCTARSARLGDPSLVDTQVGPITTPPQYDKVLQYIDIARNEGAECLLGGGASDAGRWFIQPTIFGGVKNTVRRAQEEVFGPVLSIIKFSTEDEAIDIANDTLYGLAAGVWTQDYRRLFRMASALDAGTIWLNTYRALSYTPPFGGVKNSGVGAENGAEAVNEFLRTKSVWLNYDAEVQNPFVMRL